MKAVTALSILALVGSTLAAPAPGYERPHKVVYKTVYHTVVDGGNAPAPTPAPEPAPEPAPPAVTSAAPAPPASPAPEEAEEPKSGNDGYMGVIDQWRSKMGMAALKYSDKLEANALNCVTESNGVMKHKLNDGSYGQVLAPGSEDDFEHVFVGGWLCEIPTLPGLDGVCDEQSKGWTYQGQTGHAEILTDDSYKTIGCALFNGIWGCDVGFDDEEGGISQ